MPLDAPKRRQEDSCAHHSILEFKGNLALAALGANLVGILIIAAASCWGVYKVIPEFKAAVVAEMSKTQQRAEVVEYRITKIEQVADKYLADMAEYESHMKGGRR